MTRRSESSALSIVASLLALIISAAIALTWSFYAREAKIDACHAAGGTATYGPLIFGDEVACINKDTDR